MSVSFLKSPLRQKALLSLVAFSFLTASPVHATSGRWQEDGGLTALAKAKAQALDELMATKAAQDQELADSQAALAKREEALLKQQASQRGQEDAFQKQQAALQAALEQEKAELQAMLAQEKTDCDKEKAELRAIIAALEAEAQRAAQAALKNTAVDLKLTANDEAYITFTEGVYKALTAFTTQAEPLLNSLLASADPECDAKLAFFLCGAVKDTQAVYEGTMSSGMADALTTALMGFERDTSLANWPKPDNKILKEHAPQGFNMRDRIWERWRDGGTFKSSLKSKAFQTNPEADTPSRQYVDQMIALQKKTPEFADL